MGVSLTSRSNYASNSKVIKLHWLIILLWGSLLLSPGSWCTQGFVWILKEPLFPPVLWKFCNQILLTFKVKFPGDSQSLCWVPRLWNLTWDSKPSQQCENVFGIIVLQFVSCPPDGSTVELMATFFKRTYATQRLPGLREPELLSLQ